MTVVPAAVQSLGSERSRRVEERGDDDVMRTEDRHRDHSPGTRPPASLHSQGRGKRISLENFAQQSRAGQGRRGMAPGPGGQPRGDVSDGRGGGRR